MKFPLSFVFLLLLFSSCSPEPEDIRFDADTCSGCEMKISDARFPAQLITAKGKIYKFDAVECLIHSLRETPEMKHNARLFVASFSSPHIWLEADKAYYLRGGKIQSPMGGNAAAFADKMKAESAMKETGGTMAHWSEIQLSLNGEPR